MAEQAKKASRAQGPHIPPDWEVADASAIQALVDGIAEPDQQKRALNWIIEKAAGTYEFNFYPSDRDTCFALGRAFVGQQIVKLMRINTSSMVRT
jgi:hypothetical protein